MTVENRFNAILSDPGGRVLRLHAASLAKAAEARRAADGVAACHHAQTQRQAINCDQVRREYDLHHCDVDRADLSRAVRRIYELEAELAACRCDDETRAPDPSASPPKRRKAYANDPIGKIPPPEAKTPSSLAPPVEIANYPHVTNLGTLLDALA